jgi:rfaE bifunctional protein nucleotidyltransferase chain/domain
MRNAEAKILSREQMLWERQRLRQAGLTLVFTNGCFDILHGGHTALLEFARSHGDALVVGLNADDSVRRIKGPHRPINNQRERALVLASLEAVDYVVLFEEDEPATLIGQILPDVLVKGADWDHYVSGRDVVERNGGRVVLARLVTDKSTSGTIARVLEREGGRR